MLPPAADIFNAFNFTPFDDVNVVIIGQDPYFNAGQAHGLCFSVQKGVKVPPSLATIYNELEESIPGFKRPNHGFLEKWAHQGVLLLNATLTVEQGKANSHQKCGWQTFTDTAIKALSDKKEGVVFLLWGGFAQKKGSLIDKKKKTSHFGSCSSFTAGWWQVQGLRLLQANQRDSSKGGKEGDRLEAGPLKSNTHGNLIYRFLSQSVVRL